MKTRNSLIKASTGRESRRRGSQSVTKQMYRESDLLVFSKKDKVQPEKSTKSKSIKKKSYSKDQQLRRSPR